MSRAVRRTPAPRDNEGLAQRMEDAEALLGGAQVLLAEIKNRPALHAAGGEGVEPNKVHNGGFSTDATDPEQVKALARRVLRPLRERAKMLGYALTVHGSLERDIDLVAVPWTDAAHEPEHLANSIRQVLEKLYGVGLEAPPNAEHPKPHGRLCWSFWIRPWTYIDLSVFPPQLKEQAQ